jgi:hypothetical protein
MGTGALDQQRPALGKAGVARVGIQFAAFGMIEMVDG